jgi:excisionase
MKEITYKPVSIDEKAEWGDYEHLVQKREGLKPRTARAFVEEMRKHPEFQAFVETPTHKLVFVHYKGFHLFLKWKERNRYRTKKESMADMLRAIEEQEKLIEKISS